MIGAQARLKKNSADAHAGPLLPLWAGFAVEARRSSNSAPEGTFRHACQPALGCAAPRCI